MPKNNRGRYESRTVIYCGHSHDVPKLKEVLETVTEVVVKVSHSYLLWADSQLPQCSIGRKAFIEDPNPFPPLTHFTKGPFWWALGPFLGLLNKLGRFLNRDWVCVCEFSPAITRRN